MIDLHENLVKAVSRLKKQSQDAVTSIDQTNSSFRDVIAKEISNKIRDHIDSLRLQARQSYISEAKSTVEAIATFSSLVYKRSIVSTTDLLDEDTITMRALMKVTDSTVINFTQVLHEHDEHLSNLDNTHADLMQDHFNRYLGMYIERLYRDQDLNTRRVILICQNAIECFELINQKMIEDSKNGDDLILEEAEINFQDRLAITFGKQTAFLTYHINWNKENNSEWLETVQAVNSSDALRILLS